MYNLPPLGLINIATCLKGTKHNVEILDFVLSIRTNELPLNGRIYNRCSEIIIEKEPDIVGFSTQCTTYPPAIQISENIKRKLPGVKVVFGGHNSSFLDIETLKRFPFIDSVVRGEGEITFKELVESYGKGGNGEGVLGVTYRKEDRVIRNPDRPPIDNLDILPIPDYSLVPPLSTYRNACGLNRNIVIIEAGRGCPHNCIYCSQSIFWKRKQRRYSPSRIVSEIKTLHEIHSAECFILAYDQFTSAREFVKDFCHKMIQHGLNHLSWYCISRLDTVDKELLKLMRSAGCESMCYGIDSGSPKTLSFIRKRINHSILFERLRDTTDNGIVPTLSFIIGFPEEEKEDIETTLELALRAGILGNNSPLIQMPTILPGTDLYNKYKDVLRREVDTYFAQGIEFENGKRLISDEKLINESSRIFSSFYNLPCRGMDLKRLSIICNYFPLIVQFYPKSFYLLKKTLKMDISDLFMNFIEWVKKKTKRLQISLYPQDCYRYFTPFFKEIIKGKEIKTFIMDILRYETLCLESAKFSTIKDESPIREIIEDKEIIPRKRKGIIQAEFRHDISDIISDMINDSLKDYYPEKISFLLFRHTENILEVSEIDPFTARFLTLSNGQLTMSEIMGILKKDFVDMETQELKKRLFMSAEAVLKDGYIILRKGGELNGQD